MKRTDYTGQRFGKIVLVYFIGMDKHYFQHYLCKCDCDNTKDISLASVRKGLTTSCGCVGLLNLGLRKKHGATKRGGIQTPTYRSWAHMRQRCNNPNNQRYARYGGRGIKVCSRWMEPNGKGYINFLRDMGTRPVGTSIDRIDNNGNYEPNNCRWATKELQYANQEHRGRYSK